MARIDTLANFLTDIAAAIKVKTGKSDPITPANFDTEINNIPTGGDTSIEDAFMSGTQNVEYSNDRITVLNEGAFRYVKNLTSINLPLITEIKRYSFSECSALVNASFAELTTLRESAFNYCENLTNLYAPNVTRIEVSCFKSCKKLEYANFPLVTYLGGYAFDYCVGLKEANFPLATETNNSVFRECTSLVKVDFGLLTNIFSGYFYNCTSLTTLILRSQKVAYINDSNTFTNTPIANGTGYIYVPDDLVESYKVAGGWTTYAAQIKPLSELEAE